ncbi:hypothetical protein D1007_05637 [Hordeum vulgare]|nr:hypothetical protein D1007_05637 [Hordeum vulgare]
MATVIAAVSASALQADGIVRTELIASIVAVKTGSGTIAGPTLAAGGIGSHLTWEEAQSHAANHVEDHRIQESQNQRLYIVEMDEHAMKAWHQRFPHNDLEERESWARQRVVRAAKRVERRERKATVLVQYDLGETSTRNDNNDHWNDAFLTSDYTTEESEEEENFI